MPVSQRTDFRPTWSRRIRHEHLHRSRSPRDEELQRRAVRHRCACTGSGRPLGGDRGRDAHFMGCMPESRNMQSTAHAGVWAYYSKLRHNPGSLLVMFRRALSRVSLARLLCVETALSCRGLFMTPMAHDDNCAPNTLASLSNWRQLMKVLAMVLAGGQGFRLHPLTADRSSRPCPTAAVTVLPISFSATSSIPRFMASSCWCNTSPSR